MSSYELGMISSVRLGGRKEVQLKKSAWSICIQSLKLASYSLLRGIMIDVKQTLTQSSCVFNMKFNILSKS